MGKEKVQVLEIKENERIFHYEVLGIVLFTLSLLAIAKLGIVGEYLMLITKLLFGDWFFLIYGITIAYSIRCIIFHKRLNFNSVRYIGIFILILSIILLSHFSVHNFVKDYEENHLVLTIKLYFNSFKNENPDGITGGGIIGATIFYLFYYLFSSVGVICLSMILIFLGIVFISKKTIKEFIQLIVLSFKKVYGWCKKFVNKIKNGVDKFDISYSKSKVKFKINKVNVDAYYKSEEEFARRNVETIKKILNGMNVFYNEISFIICRNVTTYFILSHFNFSYEAFHRNLSNYFHTFQLKKDEHTNELLIEINNINQVPLRISEINQQNSEEVIFGIDDRNELLKLDNNYNKLLIIGTDSKFISEYLDSIVLSLLYYKNNINYSYLDFTLNSKLSTSDSLDELDHILVKVNERIEKFNNLKISNINDIKDKKEKFNLIIINGVDKIIEDSKVYDKIMYLIEVTKNYGYLFVFSNLDKKSEKLNLYNSFEYRIFLDKESNYANKCLTKYNFNYLNNKVEGYLLYKSIVIRASLLLASKEELMSIK